jgi:hypothetical protein
MKLFLAAIFSLIISGCTSKEIEKPAVSIGKFSRQSVQIVEVVKKLMSEPDVKVMNFMADGVESTRAISCDAVGEECNVYYEFINKVVDLTKDGDLSEADRAILVGIQNKLYTELQKSEVKLRKEWKTYIETQGEKESVK